MKLLTLVLVILLFGLAAKAAGSSVLLDCPRGAWGCATPAEKQAVKQAIRVVFGVGWQARVARCIAYAESGFNPYARNGEDTSGGSHGAFQINGVHRSWVDFRRIYRPLYNARVAFRLSRGGSRWGAWTTHGKCGV